MGIGDWGLGIGQSPSPNPQSPLNFLIVLKPYIIIISPKQLKLKVNN